MVKTKARTERKPKAPKAKAGKPAERKPKAAERKPALVIPTALKGLSHVHEKLPRGEPVPKSYGTQTSFAAFECGVQLSRIPEGYQAVAATKKLVVVVRGAAPPGVVRAKDGQLDEAGAEGDADLLLAPGEHLTNLLDHGSKHREKWFGMRLREGGATMALFPGAAPYELPAFKPGIGRWPDVVGFLPKELPLFRFKISHDSLARVLSALEPLAKDFGDGRRGSFLTFTFFGPRASDRGAGTAGGMVGISTTVGSHTFEALLANSDSPPAPEGAGAKGP